jgi:hypothetical protein
MQYLPWHQNGPNTMAAFDKMNTNLTGLKNSLSIDWIANPYAELIDSIWVSQTDGNYSNATAFKLGSTEVVATPDGAGAKFTSITGSLEYINAPLDGFREIGFSYRTTDGTKKYMTNYFYP